MILLLIRRMTATFGKLQGQTLTLRPGFNIIQAPNESGKSTWCAFLLSMLYGINSRERDRAGFIADKNRYASWNGAAMSGRMDCQAGGQDLTITRVTKRQTAPLGDFRAVYAGTGEPVANLTGQTCGETLLGVSREVYERSAFIRQSGLAVTQDAELERRIAALITSGEEDTSYSEAATALKKQLNRRRHNKTGQIPALEADLQAVEGQLSEVETLEQQLAQARTQVEQLQRQEAALQEELARQDRWEARQARQKLQQLEDAAARAESHAASLRQQLDADHIPENDSIARLRGAIVNLETVRKSAEKARAERDEAMKALLRAEAAVGESPFAGQTAEQARREAAAPPAGKPSYAAATVLAVCGLIAAAALGWGLWSMGPLPALGFAAAVVLASIGGAWALRRSAQQKARRAAAMKRYGTADPDAIAAAADTYYKLCEARDAAQETVHAKTATADALYASLSSNEQGILLEVRRFAPSAFDIPTADSLLRSCALRRKALQEAEAAAREARMRWQLLTQQTPPPSCQDTDDAPPARSRDAVRADLAAAQSALAAARSSADRLAGQLHALGDGAVLRSTADSLLERKSALEGEYAALQLALETLESANTTLQNRFSPALGRRAAGIFSALTAGRYAGVVLDRSFHLSAEPAGEAVYRDAGLLSAGALDQLYLAVRLAICDLVLPRDRQVPIVLDDALANFDDRRCADALTYLKEAARDRQILLFTCHSREAAFFRDDGEVFVQELTQAGGQV